MLKIICQGAAICSIVALLCGTAAADVPTPGNLVAVNIDTTVNGTTYNIWYWICLPDGYDSVPDSRWPMIQFMGGAGEVGDYHLVVTDLGMLPGIIYGNAGNLPALTNHCILLAPTVSSCELRDQTNAFMLQYALSHFRVDTSRVYLTGLCYGAAGCFNLAATHHQSISAIETFSSEEDASGCTMPLLRDSTINFGDISYRLVHNQFDVVVDWYSSAYIADSVYRYGGDVCLILRPDEGHDSWTASYQDTETYEWLYSHSRETSLLPPRILPKQTEFLDTLTLAIKNNTTGAKIFYTIDGSLPTQNSTFYTRPFIINATKTVSAISVVNGVASQPTTAKFTQTSSFDAESTGVVSSGVLYRYLEGNQYWYLRPPTTSGFCPSVVAPSGMLDSAYTLEYSGFFSAPSDGSYTFAFTGPAQSQVSINGLQVGPSTPISLRKGPHSFFLLGTGTSLPSSVAFTYSNGQGATAVPASMLSRDDRHLTNNKNTLRVISPSGGAYRFGQSMAIQWYGDYKRMNTTVVQLKVSPDNGQNYYAIRPINITSASWGNYSWVIPDSILNTATQKNVSLSSTNCVLRAESFDGTFYDCSQPFSLSSNGAGVADNSKAMNGAARFSVRSGHNGMVIDLPRENGVIVVYRADGKAVMSRNFGSEGPRELTVGAAPSGIYFVTIRGETGYRSKRVVYTR